MHLTCSVLNLKSSYQKFNFLKFLRLNKTYIVGTQKNRLIETVLLAPKTFVKIDG